MAEPHLDRRQLLRALLLVGAGLAVPAACGVPSGGGPIVDGAGPSYDPVGGEKGRPPEPDDASSAANLVELFLVAISGPLDTTAVLTDARERARRFLTRQAKDFWKPPDSVTVVRVEGLTSSISGADAIVSGTLQPVGSLIRDRGLVDPSSASGPVPVKFTVSQDGSGLRISELPGALQTMLPLATDALDNKYFTPQLIYFWDTRQRWLVPDLRYVPSTGLADTGRLTEIVKWLLLAPSDLINSVVGPFFPNGTDLSVPNVLIQGGRVVVPFTAALQNQKDLARVVAQLQWSLQPLHKLTDGVDLQIAAQTQQVTGAADLYRKYNPADDVTSRTADPQTFCVTGNAVQALDGSLPAVVAKPEYNRDVLMAALSRDRRDAALLTTGKRLTLGRADDTGTVSYLPVDLTGHTWSRPAWLPLSRRLLVIVDGQLRVVSATGVVSAQPVATGITAFAVAPDGYRIALIASGVLGVAALHDDSDQLTVSSPVRPLDTGLSDLTGVAWSRMERLVVAGKTGSNQWRLAEVSIDGAIRVVWKDVSFFNPIVSVVAYPRLPSEPPGPGQVLVQTGDNAVFRVFVNASSATSQPLTGKAGPSPSPSGPGTANRPVLTAPFYPD